MALRILLLSLAFTSLAAADGFVSRPGGRRIAYAERPGPGPALVLIPGSWGDRSVFDELVAALPAKLHVLIVELPGHGRSRPALAHPEMDALGADVLAAVDKAFPDHRRFYVSGHSIGGMLAIAIAGMRPGQVAGALPMEGWPHHLVQAEAFPEPYPAVLSPEESARNQSNRERVISTLTPAERTAFGTVWRRWDGTGILASTPVPMLHFWGDRGKSRPDRAKLGIPERSGMEIAWMPGATHSLLVQRSREMAPLIAGFIARTEATHMYAVSKVTRLEPEVISIYKAEEHIAGFNMHPYITFHDGKFWAMWSSNRIRDLQAGQYVRYATSSDGKHWSKPAALTPSEEAGNFRYFARGFWRRNGELWALAARDEAVRPLFGPGLELRGYRWANGRWQPPIRIAADAINNFAPDPLPGGEWMMSRRDHRMNVSMLAGGREAPDQWRVLPVPKPADNAQLDEPIWWTLPDGDLTAVFRDGSRSRRLYRSFSSDQGRTWTAPVRTDFPDAMAKMNVLRLRNGLYVMASNPNPSGVRIPLSLSVSRDGRLFHAQAILRDAPTVYRYGGKDPGYAGYHYPQLLEHDGWLYIIHAENMEDIVLLRLPGAVLPHSP